MRTKKCANFVAGWLLVLVVGVSGNAAVGQSQEFVSLIDSQSLTGWKGDVDSWQVQDGVLTGTADGTLKANRFLVAEIEPVRNFELLVDVRISAGGNSGLQYRSVERPDLGPFVVTGYQCDVVSNNDRYNGMLYEERGRRILSHTGERVVVDEAGQPWVVGTVAVRSFPPEEWHRYRVLVEGNRHRHWIDDHPTADLIDLDTAGRSLSGVLGVQVHVGPRMQVQYRNMRLKRLPDDLPLLTASSPEAMIPADAQKVEPQGGWKQAGVYDMNAVMEPAPAGSGAAFRAGNLWLGGQPSPEELQRLPGLGIDTVISFRRASELTWDERAAVEALGMKYVEIPFREPSELTDAVFERTMQVLRETDRASGVLLHCSSGNRTAAVWLVHRVINGRMAPAQAIEEARRMGLTSTELEEAAVDYLVRHRRMER